MQKVKKSGKKDFLWKHRSTSYHLPVLGISVSDGILHGGVKVLQRLIVRYLSPFDTVRIATSAGFAELLELFRQFAIGIL